MGGKEENQGAERLILRRGCDVLIHLQMGQKSLDLRNAPLSRMPLVVEKDKAPDPTHLSIFGPDGVVLSADHCAHLIKQPGRMLSHLFTAEILVFIWGRV